MSLETPTTHPHLFFNAQYKCTACNHKTHIYLLLDYEFYNICQSDEVCASCNEEKDLICDGDLILRYDWLDPDNDSWQMQCACIPDGTGYCEGCKDKFTGNYKNILVAYSKCNNTMIYAH